MSFFTRAAVTIFSLIKKVVTALLLSVLVVALGLFAGEVNFSLATAIPLIIFFLLVYIANQFFIEKKRKQLVDQDDDDGPLADESTPDVVSHR